MLRVLKRLSELTLIIKPLLSWGKDVLNVYISITLIESTWLPPRTRSDPHRRTAFKVDCVRPKTISQK